MDGELSPVIIINGYFYSTDEDDPRRGPYLGMASLKREGEPEYYPIVVDGQMRAN